MGAALGYGGIVGEANVDCCNEVEEAVPAVGGGGGFVEGGRP